MLDRLLAVARLDSSAARPEMGTVNLSVLVAEIVADAQFEARERDRSVQLSNQEEIHVRGNRDLLRSAFENIIGNAARYTVPGSTVQVRLECEAGSNSAMALFTVRDFGPGVPESELANIFSPFYRVAGARDRNSGGTGLGLAIADRVASRVCMGVLLWQQTPLMVDSKFACEFLQIALEIVSVWLVALIETYEYGEKLHLSDTRQLGSFAVQLKDIGGINIRFHPYPPKDFLAGGRPLSDVVPLVGRIGADAPEIIVSVDEALGRLAVVDSRKSDIVQCLYFASMIYDETAAALRISAARVDRELRMAKAWFHRELGQSAAEDTIS